METIAKTERTEYEKVADAVGLHPHALAAIQRTGAVPSDIEDLSENDLAFLQVMSRIVGNPGLLRLQLSRKPFARRVQIIEGAADFERYKKWERYALTFLEEQYRQGGACVVEDVMPYLRLRFGVRLNDTTKARIQQLMDTARKRVAYEKEKKEKARPVSF